MSMFRCKMCGGTLDIQPGMTVAECEYCGTKQTLPRLDNDKKRNLYDRANHFRRNSEYDKAMAIYEQILNEDSTDAEAYWSLVLGRYGIEYVEDPVTHRRVPTVNRAQFTSIFADEDYKSALQYADGYQRQVYQAEAKAIDEIQKGILTISRQEEPFDVFICYKENDAMGRRTPDSVLANELYHQLTEEGFKVFFARITLENKLGSAYEPYIFAALNSAKVMVVLGTKPEHFKAVWVRNEWFRFLSLMKNGENKVLIPAYKDMDPYDLPEEFSHLQAQDMSQLGFMQDLIRGIRKILSNGEPERASAPPSGGISASPTAAPLLKRVFLFLEDGDWESADEYCEKVLDLEPENAQAYLGKLMAEFCVSRQEQLADCEEPFDYSSHYQKILRFADPALKGTVQGYVKQIKERNEDSRCRGLYQEACRKKEKASSEQEYIELVEIFQSISGFQDADTLAAQCQNRAEEYRKKEVYRQGCRCVAKYQEYVAASGYNHGDQQPFRLIAGAVENFRSIPGWQDADEKLKYCENEIRNIRQKQEEDRLEQERLSQQEAREAKKKEKRRKIRKRIVALAAIAAIAGVVINYKSITLWIKYQTAKNEAEHGYYNSAVELFRELDGYKDSRQQIALLIEKDREERSRGERSGYALSAKSASVGDSILFGSYPQNDISGQEKQEIGWKVIGKKAGKILVISTSCLDCKPFHTEKEAISWKRSFIRKWLNGTFLEEAFSQEERDSIVTVEVKNESNPMFHTKGGKDTEDQVFLLSVSEVERYFPEDSMRMADSTRYTENKEIQLGQHSYEDVCWLTRTMGKDKEHVVNVSYYKGFDYTGNLVTDKNYGIRPALWIDPEKLPL